MGGRGKNVAELGSATSMIIVKGREAGTRPGRLRALTRIASKAPLARTVASMGPLVANAGDLLPTLGVVGVK